MQPDDKKPRWFRASLLACCAVLASCVAALISPPRAAADTERTYDITYALAIAAARDVARASITIGHGAANVREIRFRIDADRHERFRGDGEIRKSDGYITWRPPKVGGTLRYNVRIAHQRGNSGYDAYVGEDWALFRGDDIFPAAKTRTLVGANSRARFRLELPKDWSSLAPYPGDGENAFLVDNPERRFDRPTGWILAGKLGVRRANIAATRIAIGAPLDAGLRRMDIMAFLNWTLPGVRSVFTDLPARIVIVGAGEPMWRGGLSGPGSIYLHAERPLISENGTSTLLHELVHVAMGVAGSDHDDWVVEGLAEYYSVKLLRDSGSLGARRAQLTLEALQTWGKDVDDLFTSRASGPVTARAATLFARLDADIARRAPDRADLDDVVKTMIASKKPYSYRALCEAAREVAQGHVPMLAPQSVPGAPDVAACRKAKK